MENSGILWVVVLVSAIVVGIVWMWQRDRTHKAILLSALQVQAGPMVIIDERGRVVYAAPGLVLFDRRSARRLATQFERPERGQEVRGEVEIDGNVYYYTSKLLEYKPGREGVAVWLEYRRGKAAN